MEVIDLPRSRNAALLQESNEVGTVYFDSENDFRKALRKCADRLEEDVDVIVKHEKAHVDTARNLGYSAKYCLSRMGKDYQPSSLVNNGDIRVIPIDDLITILSAPKEPGYDDQLKLKYLRDFKRMFCKS